MKLSFNPTLLISVLAAINMSTASASSSPLAPSSSDVTNVIAFSSCRVSDKQAFLNTFASVANLLSAENPGVEAWAVMESPSDDSTVAIVEAYSSADDFGPHLETAGDAVGTLNALKEDCTSVVWGDWPDTMKDHFTAEISGTHVFHTDQEGFVDFCKDDGGKQNFPNMVFFERRTTDAAANIEAMQVVGSYLEENIPGVLAWVTAVDPDDPAVVHDLQLFRDIYTFIDHSSPLVVPIMDWVGQLLPTWAMPLDYTASFVGYDATLAIPQEEVAAQGFPDMEFLGFSPRGTLMGQQMGFMKLCSSGEAEASKSSSGKSSSSKKKPGKKNSGKKGKKKSSKGRGRRRSG